MRSLPEDSVIWKTIKRDNSNFFLTENYIKSFGSSYQVTFLAKSPITEAYSSLKLPTS